MTTLTPNSVFILVCIFSVAIFLLISMLYLFGPSPKETRTINHQEVTTLEDIMRILDSPKTNNTKLTRAVNLFFENYEKLDLSDYRKKCFLSAIVIHPNTSTELIIHTEERLRKLNPDLERELNKTLNHALDSRMR